MSPVTIIALVRDATILGALIFIVVWIRTDGANAVKVQDLQALQKSLAINAQKQSEWAQEARDATNQRIQDMATVTAAIAAQRTPVFVQSGPQPACPRPVPSPTTAPTGQSAAAGGTDTGPGKPVQSLNIREGLNNFERRYEETLADCRAMQASWPR